MEISHRDLVNVKRSRKELLRGDLGGPGRSGDLV